MWEVHVRSSPRAPRVLADGETASALCSGSGSGCGSRSRSGSGPVWFERRMGLETKLCGTLKPPGRRRRRAPQKAREKVRSRRTAARDRDRNLLLLILLILLILLRDSVLRRSPPAAAEPGVRWTTQTSAHAHTHTGVPLQMLRADLSRPRCRLAAALWSLWDALCPPCNSTLALDGSSVPILAASHPAPPPSHRQEIRDNRSLSARAAKRRKLWASPPRPPLPAHRASSGF